jgi:MFS family permease
MPGAECVGRFAMPQPSDDSRSLGAFAPALVLLAICLVINYVDRGNLSIAAPLLKNELRLSPLQLGILFAAFFTTYTVMQFVIGWLVDHFDANWILGSGFLLWSLSTVATGLVWGFGLLLSMRLILGVGESVALPSCSKILTRHLPEHNRGLASGVLMSALRCGNAVGTFGAGFLMAKFGWRPVFIGVGLVSLLWLPAWRRWMPRNVLAMPRTQPRHNNSATSQSWSTSAMALLFNKNETMDAGNSDSKRIAWSSDTQQAFILLDFHVFSDILLDFHVFFDTKFVAFRCHSSYEPVSRSEFYPQPVSVLGQRSFLTDISNFRLIPSVGNFS